MYNGLRFKNLSNKKTKVDSFSLMNWCFIGIILFLFSPKGFSQPNSFQLILDSVGYRMHDIAVNENEEIILFMKKFPDNNMLGFYLLPFEGTVGTVQGLEISIPSNYIIRSEYHHDRIIFIAYGASYPIPNTTTYTGKSIIFNIDLASNSKWSKYLNGQIRQNKFSTNKNGNIFLANTPSNNFHDVLYGSHTAVLELFKLDVDGNMIWKKGILLLDSLFSEFPDVNITDMALETVLKPLHE